MHGYVSALLIGIVSQCGPQGCPTPAVRLYHPTVVRTAAAPPEPRSAVQASWVPDNARLVSVKVRVLDALGVPGIGSGTIIASAPGKSYVLTAYHMLEDGAASIQVSRGSAGWDRPGRVVACDRRSDLALLETDYLGPWYVPLAVEQPRQIVVVGYGPLTRQQAPLAHLGRFVRRFDDGDIQYDVRTTWGYSGGGAFSPTGQLAGVLVAKDDPEGWGQGIIVPVVKIRSFLRTPACFWPFVRSASYNRLRANLGLNIGINRESQVIPPGSLPIQMAQLRPTEVVPIGPQPLQFDPRLESAPIPPSVVNPGMENLVQLPSTLPMNPGKITPSPQAPLINQAVTAPLLRISVYKNGRQDIDMSGRPITRIYEALPSVHPITGQPVLMYDVITEPSILLPESPTSALKGLRESIPQSRIVPGA